MTANADVDSELHSDRLLAEQLQDRLRREQQTATALREYLLSRAEASAESRIDAD